MLGGGFTAGFSAGIEFSVNTMVGPVPVTASFGIGGAIQVDYKTAVRYSQQPGLAWASTVTADAVNDYLTTLRLQAYVNAFGGVGLDYSVVSLKIGLFGKMTVDSSNLFLSRTYLAEKSQQQLKGQRLGITGQVGVKFVASLCDFINYELVLASASASYSQNFGELTKINDYWKNTGSGLQGRAIANYAAQNGLRVASSSATLTSRDYLDEYARSWNQRTRLSRGFQLFAIDEANKLDKLQTNANPAARPLITADGALLLYVNDGYIPGENENPSIYQSRVYAGILDGDSYTPGDDPITAPEDFDGFGDSSVALAGSQGFAAAAWIRLAASLEGKDAGDKIGLAEQNLLQNSTEIVVAIYDDGAWTSTRLTVNSTPDMAPAVATNGQRAIAVWRSVYAGNPANVTDFAAQDTIMYSVYDGGDWSKAQELYNGTAGAVKALQAAMLPDGTAAVVYTLDRDNADGGDNTDYEIAYTIVDDQGEVGLTMICTSDQWLDENPQIAAVNFGTNDDATADNRFVIGWHSLRDNVGDIRLLAVNAAGQMSNSFPESISQVVNNNAVKISGNFRFADMDENNNSLDDLTLVWIEAVNNEDGETDHSALRAVKFRQQDDGISLSAPLELAELPPRTLADHFDVYVSGDNEIMGVIQGTWYDDDPENVVQAYDKVNDVYISIPKERVDLFTATASFVNEAQVSSVMPDYANLSLNSLNPIQFQVFNAGLDDITQVYIQLGGEEYTFTGMTLAPNASATLTCWHPIGDAVVDLNYQLTATFGSSDTHQLADKVYLDYPDIGVSQMTVVSEENGLRTIRLTLYNSSAATLAGKGRSVQLGFFDNNLYETDNLPAIDCAYTGVKQQGNILTIDRREDLELIDQGSFTIEVVFNLGDYVKTVLIQDEIPEGGVRLFARAGVYKAGEQLPEYSDSDNAASLAFDSLLSRSGQPVSLDVEQGVDSSGKTTATISLKNNSLQPQSSGNVVASLLDARGNVLEQVQTYADGSLITLKGEEVKAQPVAFNQSGSRVKADYGVLAVGSNSSQLTSIGFEGLAVNKNSFAETAPGSNSFVAAITGVTASSTLVSFMTEDPAATVSINGQPSDGSVKVAIPRGASSIVITVTAHNGTVSSYTLNLQRSAAGGGGGQPGQPVIVPEQPEGENPFIDVLSSHWFYDDVLTAYRDGLVNGRTATTYVPYGSVTIAEAVKLAACMNQLNATGSVTLANGSPLWYSTYVEYALANGIISEGQFSDYNAVASRAQFAEIFAKALPTAALPQINEIRDGAIPDVKLSDSYGPEVYRLYQAGVLRGNDAKLTFAPTSDIKRSEVATIVTRMMHEEKRVKI